MTILTNIQDLETVYLTTRATHSNGTTTAMVMDLISEETSSSVLDGEAITVTHGTYYSSFSHTFPTLIEGTYYTLVLSIGASEYYRGKVFVTGQDIDTYEVNVENTDYKQTTFNNEYIILE